MKFSTLKKRHWLPILALGAALSLPQAPAHAGLFSMSEQDEIEAGREVAAQAQKEYGPALPSNDPMARRVSAIGEQFARLSTRKNIPYSYQVLANDKVLNAFAAPGGPVFVTRLLVNTTANDAELAYVVGHETGHIERKHIVESAKKQQQAGLMVGVLGAILGKGKSSNAIGTIANVGWTFLSSGYSRDQETEADITGVRWMSQLGYDPQAAISMLGKLGNGGGGFLDKYLATHPAPEKRQQTVQALIAKENLTNVAQRSGGPKLWMAGTNNWGTGNYNNTYYPPNNAPTWSQNNQPPTYSPPNQQTDERLDLGEPFMVATAGNNRVVMAPVLEMARWAGARARTGTRVTVVTLGDNRLEIQPNVKRAWINGETVDLSVPAIVQNDVLYAPVGTVARGMGGDAVYDAQSRTIWVTIDNRRGYIPLQ